MNPDSVRLISRDGRRTPRLENTHIMSTITKSLNFKESVIKTGVLTLSG